MKIDLIKSPQETISYVFKDKDIASKIFTSKELTPQDKAKAIDALEKIKQLTINLVESSCEAQGKDVNEVLNKVPLSSECVAYLQRFSSTDAMTSCLAQNVLPKASQIKNLRAEKFPPITRTLSEPPKSIRSVLKNSEKKPSKKISRQVSWEDLNQGMTETKPPQQVTEINPSQPQVKSISRAVSAPYGTIRGSHEQPLSESLQRAQSAPCISMSQQLKKAFLRKEALEKEYKKLNDYLNQFRKQDIAVIREAYLDRANALSNECNNSSPYTRLNIEFKYAKASREYEKFNRHHPFSSNKEIKAELEKIANEINEVMKEIARLDEKIDQIS
jgi:hypothetical protein